MSRVFVIQRPVYYDRQRRGWVNKYDLGPAEIYGELIYLLPQGNIYTGGLKEALKTLEEKLLDFSTEDCILAVGDPVAIACAVMVASANNEGTVRLLKFDRMENIYNCYTIDVGVLNV